MDQGRKNVTGQAARPDSACKNRPKCPAKPLLAMFEAAVVKNQGRMPVLVLPKLRNIGLLRR